MKGKENDRIGWKWEGGMEKTVGKESRELFKHSKYDLLVTNHKGKKERKKRREERIMK